MRSPPPRWRRCNAVTEFHHFGADGLLARNCCVAPTADHRHVLSRCILRPVALTRSATKSTGMSSSQPDPAEFVWHGGHARLQLRFGGDRRIQTLRDYLDLSQLIGSRTIRPISKGKGGLERRRSRAPSFFRSKTLSSRQGPACRTAQQFARAVAETLLVETRSGRVRMKLSMSPVAICGAHVGGCAVGRHRAGLGSADSLHGQGASPRGEAPSCNCFLRKRPRWALGTALKRIALLRCRMTSSLSSLRGD